MRDPHSVWHSLFNYYNRLAHSVGDDLRQKNIEHGGVERYLPGPFMRDFIKGMLVLPPRLREKGPSFSWAHHVGAWHEQLLRWREHGQPVHIVDFNAAMADPISAVREIDAVVHRATQHPRLSEELLRSVTEQTEHEDTRSRLTAYQGGELDLAAKAHVGGASLATAPGSWQPAFDQAPQHYRNVFNSTTQAYSSIAGNAAYRADRFVLP